MSFLEKIFGNYSEKELKKINPVVDKIESYDSAMQALTDEELRAKTEEFKGRLAAGETLDDLLPEAFAAVREAAWRVRQMKPFRVQLIGGIVLHQGRIAEMKTGEGKTLVAVMPAYLNALEGKGVHIVTVNDYLASRDADWMGEIFRFMGLSVGVILNGLTSAERQAAYACDITYATNNELGFDYLRDNMVVRIENIVQRGLHYAIIDEVDSILIDEARTPLIISGSGTKSTQLYEIADAFAKRLKKGRILNEEDALNPLIKEEIKEEGDFVVDEKAKTVTLTQQGVEKAEKFFNIENLSDPENIEILHHIIDDPACLSDREVGTDGKHERNFLIRAGLAEVALMVFTIVESCVFRVYRQIKFKSLAADSHLREKVSAHTIAVAARAVTALDLTVRREMFLKLRVPFDNAFIHF